MKGLSSLLRSTSLYTWKSYMYSGWSRRINKIAAAHRSFNSYIDYPNRGQSYETQHDEFHNSDTPNRFLAYGALVGGPGADDK